MARFPSLEWCRALAHAAASDPEAPAAAREWGERTVGVVVGRDAGLARDFCVYAELDAAGLRLRVLEEREDEDDLEVDEPDYLFKLPYGLCRKLLAGAADPFESVRLGQVRVEGDLQFLLAFGRKYKAMGDRCTAAVPTEY